MMTLPKRDPGIVRLRPPFGLPSPVAAPIPPSHHHHLPRCHFTATAERLHYAVTKTPRSAPMAILTIRSVPDDLYAKLKASAAEHRRSVNSEVIECLRLAVVSRRARHVEGFLGRARALREGLTARGIAVTSAEIDEAKRGGRE